MAKVLELLLQVAGTWLVLVITAVVSQSPKALFDAVGQGITKEIVAVKQPVDETIAYVGSSQCKCNSLKEEEKLWITRALQLSRASTVGEVRLAY